MFRFGKLWAFALLIVLVLLVGLPMVARAQEGTDIPPTEAAPVITSTEAVQAVLDAVESGDVPVIVVDETPSDPVVVDNSSSLINVIMGALLLVAILALLWLGHQRGKDYPADARALFDKGLDFLEARANQTATPVDNMVVNFARHVNNQPQQVEEILSYIEDIPDGVDVEKLQAAIKAFAADWIRRNAGIAEG